MSNRTSETQHTERFVGGLFLMMGLGLYVALIFWSGEIASKVDYPVVWGWVAGGMLPFATYLLGYLHEVIDRD